MGRRERRQGRTVTIPAPRSTLTRGMLVRMHMRAAGVRVAPGEIIRADARLLLARYTELEGEFVLDDLLEPQPPGALDVMRLATVDEELMRRLQTRRLIAERLGVPAGSIPIPQREPLANVV